MEPERMQSGIGSKIGITVMAGAVALALGGCDRKPATTGSSVGKTFDEAVANSSPEKQQPQQPAPQASGVSGDAALAERVKSALTTEPALKQALAVDVNAADGVVTLVGTAASAEKSHHAAIVALNVEGVRSVRNELVILAGS